MIFLNSAMFHLSSNPSYPILVLITNSKTFSLEVKEAKNYTTKLQLGLCNAHVLVGSDSQLQWVN